MKNLFYAVIILSAAALIACGGGGGGGGSSSSSTPTNAETQNFNFTLPPNTVSFLLHITGQNNSGLRAINLTNPSGQDILTIDNTKDYVMAGFNYGNVLVPVTQNQAVTSGAWTVTTTSGATGIQTTIRTGAPPTSSMLDVQPYLTGSTYSEEEIQNGLDTMKTIFTNAGLQVNLRSIIRVSEAQYRFVSASFSNLTTAQLVSQGESDVINIFFVEDFLGEDRDILGVAPAIPGSLGLVGNLNGVLINIGIHVSGTLNSQLLGETTAHEMGHFLGLFHTTERSGNEFDPLSDTPECPASQNTDDDGVVLVEECLEFDANNLMFWTAGSGVKQTTLSPGQIHVLNYSPIAR